MQKDQTQSLPSKTADADPSPPKSESREAVKRKNGVGTEKSHDSAPPPDSGQDVCVSQILYSCSLFRPALSPQWFSGPGEVKEERKGRCLLCPPFFFRFCLPFPSCIFCSVFSYSEESCASRLHTPFSRGFREHGREEGS